MGTGIQKIQKKEKKPLAGRERGKKKPFVFTSQGSKQQPKTKRVAPTALSKKGHWKILVSRREKNGNPQGKVRDLISM